MITYSDYQESVRKSDKLPTDNPRFIVLGLVGEVGDLVSLVKKEQRDSLKANTIEEHLHEELGDVLWYVTSIINRENFRIDNIVNNAIQKINLKENNIQPSTLTNLSLIDSFSTNNNLKLNTVEISLQLTISLGSFVSLYSSINTNNHNEKEITISIFVSNLLLFCFSKKISISRAIDYNL
ncbi:nucleoside triphosphate pyrophosphohydrolase family protein, partial [Enterobacter hormaechei]